MYDGYAIIPNGRPTWAPLLAASGQHPQSYEPCLMDLLCISPFIRGGPPKAPFIGELTAKGGLRG